jgi:hypothetical protein
VLRCASCGGRMRVIAFIEDGEVSRRILEHLGWPAQVPTAGRYARRPRSKTGTPNSSRVTSTSTMVPTPGRARVSILAPPETPSQTQTTQTPSTDAHQPRPLRGRHPSAVDHQNPPLPRPLTRLHSLLQPDSHDHRTRHLDQPTPESRFVLLYLSG